MNGWGTLERSSAYSFGIHGACRHHEVAVPWNGGRSAR